MFKLFLLKLIIVPSWAIPSSWSVIIVMLLSRGSIVIVLGRETSEYVSMSNLLPYRARLFCVFSVSESLILISPFSCMKCGDRSVG